MIRDVTEALFNDILKRSERPIVVEFWSPGCSVCKEVAPIYESVSEEMADEAIFLRVNTDANLNMVRRYGVQGTPTFMIFCKEGKLSEIVGMTSATMLRNTIRDVVRYRTSCRAKGRINYDIDGYG
ncbi:MAG: thioredoxin fold domain-containing protein [Methanomassiliicoccales archaeon]|nr:MAG: thioredoxin fold domain-containing protein [Methanomassiliicoccales archaeon]